MKTIEELEKQLRSWTPCRPSDRLRVKIFGRPAAEPGWRWNRARLVLASAAGLAMVAAIHLTPPAGSGRSENSYVMLATAFSNQTLVACVPPQANQEWNRPSATYQASHFGELLPTTNFAWQGRINP